MENFEIKWKSGDYVRFIIPGTNTKAIKDSLNNKNVLVTAVTEEFTYIEGYSGGFFHFRFRKANLLKESLNIISKITL